MGKKNAITIEIWGFPMTTTEGAGFLKISRTQVFWRWHKFLDGELTREQFETVGKLPNPRCSRVKCDSTDEWKSLNKRTEEDASQVLKSIPEPSRFERKLYGQVHREIRKVRELPHQVKDTVQRFEQNGMLSVPLCNPMW